MGDARIIELLRARGAAEHRHAHGRSLLDHLIECAAIVRRWGQPEELVRAALLHSVYGTDVHQDALLAASDRAEVAARAGPAAERLAFLFGTVPRESLLSGHRAAGNAVAGSGTGLGPPPERGELDALVLLHMANLAEQARSDGNAPGVWLTRLGTWAELLLDSPLIVLPRAIAGLVPLDVNTEAEAVHAYLTATTAGDEMGLALVAARLAVVGEPCVRVAELADARGARAAARAWAAEGLRRLEALGVSWDPQRSWASWHAVADTLARGGQLPRAVATSRPRRGSGGGDSEPTANDATVRFAQYVASLGGPGVAAAGRVYPGLRAQAWHDPSDFPVACQLTEQAAVIRRELLALDAGAFHPESERIARTGDWDVLFLYERGRRRDEVCDLCPVTTSIIEGPGVMRTLSGLVYVSRMRPGTHIAAHRGPTNLRLRCHLGLTVPDGDCAIRVGEETRRWSEGTCLVFDDFLEHEAWNHADAERIVLIVDLWHPDLAAAEVGWLEGLQRYALGHARGLDRYWETNARAAAASRSG